MENNIGNKALVKSLKLFRGRCPFDYFYVTIIGVRNNEYVVIAEDSEVEYLIDPKYIQIAKRRIGTNKI